jgi:hypothetical protein
MLKAIPHVTVWHIISLHPLNEYMTRLLILFLCIVVFTTQKASAQDYRLGLGLRLSNSTPTLNNSVTGKYFVTDKTAVEGLVSFGSRFGLGALLQIHNPLNIEGLRWFYGAGVYVGVEDNNTYVGPTGALGLDYKFANIPINLSLDWKPELDIVPEINFVPDAFALSVRFTLK